MRLTLFYLSAMLSVYFDSFSFHAAFLFEIIGCMF